MSVGGLAPARQAELLAPANELARRLAQAWVGRLRGEGGERGISESAVSTVASFLAAGADRRRLGEVLDELPGLDAKLAQNQGNPKAEYRALEGELRTFLAPRPSLLGDELLFVLRWAGRLIGYYRKRPGAPRGGPGGSRSAAGRRGRPAGRSAPPSRTTSPRRPSAPKAPAKATWPRATLYYNPGGGDVLTAVAADRQRAEATHEAARKLLDDGLRAHFKKKKRRPPCADVEVRREGTAWHLVAIRKPGGREPRE